jgi:predicted nuclease with TOPRIM domain
VYVDGFPMYQLYVKLRSVKAVLKNQNVTCYGNLKQKVVQARENLDLAQKEVIASFGRAESLLKESECLHAYVSMTKAEESFLKQMARNQWLQLGDQNNSFFHRSIKVKNARSTITHLWDEQGKRVDDMEQIKLVAENFYQKLLGTDQLVFNESKAARLRQLIPVAIPDDKAVLLEKEVTEEWQGGGSPCMLERSKW